MSPTTPHSSKNDSASLAAATTHNARSAIAYTTYAGSDSILILSDISGSPTPSIPSDLLTSWSISNEPNASFTVPVVQTVRNPRANLVQEFDLAEKNKPNSLTTVLLDAGHLVNAVPALYHVVAKDRKVLAHVRTEGWARSADVGKIVAGVDGWVVVLAAEGETQEVNDLSVVSHKLVEHGVPVVLVSSGLGDVYGKIQLRGLESTLSIPKDADLLARIQTAFTSTLPSPIPFFTLKGPAHPTHLIVTLNTTPASIDSLLASHASTSILRVRLLRPWSASQFLTSVPESVKTVTVIDAGVNAPGDGFGQLFLDVAGSLHGAEGRHVPVLRECRVRLAEEQLVSVQVAKAILDVVAGGKGDEPSFDVDVRALAEHPSVTAKVGTPIDSAVTPESDLEKPYLNLLNQLFASRLSLSNVITSDTVVKRSGEGSLQDGISAEYGLGLHLAAIRTRDLIVAAIRSAVASPRLPPTLAGKFNEWLKDGSVEKGKEALEAWEGFKSNEVVKGLVEKHGVESLHRVLGSPVPSRWLLGGDRLSYDIGTSGVHNVIASKSNVNILILDTQPYSEKKKGDVRKKDIGLYGMTYGGVYVASVALQTNYAGVVRALQEADAFDGPSVVVAYAPRVKASAGVSAALRALKECKVAVDEGYWPLYRWNPALSDEEKFKLDSDKIRDELQKFLERDQHLAIVSKEAEPELTVSAEKDLRETLEAKIKESYETLLASLNATPVLILYGSDGGNAAAYAKRLGAEARQRGLKPKVSVMDELTLDQLAKHTYVLFVVSTAGQGEFPGNSREMWKSLQGWKEGDVSLEGVRFGVFGMGDSHYWPLPEDKHYFVKSGRDLDARLGAVGAQRIVEFGIGNDRDADGPLTGYKVWIGEVWEALGVGAVEVEGAAVAAGPSDDAIKESSNFLRGSIAAGLVDTTTGQLAELDTKITKFHGIYQQDDRDVRDARARAGLEKAFSFMIRVRVPGGVATAKQWIAMDDIAETYANGTIKLTTRQTFQFHGVVKGVLKKTMQEINRSLMDTIAACGDVNRNVMCNPIPHHSPLHADVFEFSKKFSEHLLPHTNAYHEIWLDKKVVLTSEDVEPIYGKTYLPRKFKVAVAVPPHNDVDVFAHDLGYIAIEEKGRLVGFNVSVGGGMGMTHGMKTTYPRLGDIIGYVPVDKAIAVGEAVVTVQRDYGDRTNRKHARLKYTIDDRGIEWFKGEVEKRLGWNLEKAREHVFTSNGDRYGWIKAQDGTWSYTLFVQNGRVKDAANGGRYRSGLRAIAERLDKLNDQHAKTSGAQRLTRPEFRLSPNQNLIICGIPAAARQEFENLLKHYGIENGDLSGLRLNSMACVALPTCALAMAESERYLPDLVGRIEEVLEENGLRDDAITIRMTGCPNGCARPQVAEIAFVGKAPGSYNMYLGGGHSGERLNKIFKESVGEEEIIKSIRPIIKQYALERIKGEHFGDFVIRKGIVKATLRGMDFHDV
ncbi:hypothetical protein HDU97_006451 [Phlyctochytrium planicorne]|nr:hypothetical protein HDU97_006451 [Phlyctochytrium planicorne]